MAYELRAIRNEVKAMVQDDVPFLQKPTETDKLINGAIRQLNKDKPNSKPVDIAGDDTSDYQLPASFERNFSRVKRVEHPAGQNPPVFRVKDDDWFEYEDPSKPPGEQLRLKFKLTTPTTGEIIRATITSAHVVTLSTSTLDNVTFQAVAHKATSLYFRALSGKFNQSSIPTLGADSVNLEGRATIYLELERQHRINYNKLVGLDEKVKPAQGLREFDIRFRHGEDMLFHTTRTS